MIRSGIKVNLRRASAAFIALLLTAAAVFLFHGVVTSDGVDALDIVRLVLLAISSAWLAWGFVIALYGLIFSQAPSPRLEEERDIHGRTAILLPIYNEDVVDIVANLTAMYEDLDRLGAKHQFDFHVLSDSNKADKIALEKDVFKRIITDLNAGGSIFYRHRPNNVGRKAGNIADFIKASGAAYEYMLVLDADSLMRGHTIIEMARRMEADPKLGLLQSLPIIKGLNTLFGRAQQFSTVFYSPTFSNGLASLQGNEGNFWGHNAIIRVKAFASACGLPSLSGKPPFGGHIISHDFVEATLLIRAGWSVRLDPDLVGSYEEGPSNMLEYAKRDRRWCQGNLQHSRIISANGLSLWSRVALIQGIMAYLASPVWLLFLLTSVAAQIFAPDPVYFPDTWNLFPVFPHIESEKAYALISGILVLLIAPKTIILAKVMLSQLDKDNTVPKWSVLLSGTAELIISSMFAPIHMMYQCKSVVQILLGQDSGWPATDRNDNYMPLSISFKSAWWISLTGIIVTLCIFIFATELLLWVSPIVLPLILSPLIITMSSSQRIGRFTARMGLFLTPSELSPDVILTSAHDYQQRYARASSYTLSS